MECPSCHTSVDNGQRFCPTCGTALAVDAAAAAAQVPEDVLVGKVLGGKYKVVRLLGEGGMGAVYEGEQRLGTTKRKVAIKTLHPHLSRDEKIQARFEREVGTVAELEHPNTIQVFDYGSTADGILYIVMEFLQGKSLARVIETDGALLPDRVDRIIQQICGSLEEAHARGIVHRDLKPDNVVLVERAGKKDFVKVLDFGIAKRSHETDRNEQKLTQQGMVLGTPPYMSPEQFTGQPIDARSDIYSLGVMAYEMLTGRLPFQANTAWEWASQHMTQEPLPIESLAEGMRAPEAMRSAIRRALAKAPADRFQTVKEFGDAFSGAVPAVASTVAAATPPGRQRTEIGAPLDVQAAFSPAGARDPEGARGGVRDGVRDAVGGPAPGLASGPPIRTATAGASTPMAGNVAFPTPAAIPQPPPRASAKGKSRGLILAIAALLAVASIGAIVFAMHGGSSSPAMSSALGQGGAASQTAPGSSVEPSPTKSSDSPPAAVASGGGSDVPPLAAGGTAPRSSPRSPSHGPAGPVPGPSPSPPAGPALPATGVSPPVNPVSPPIPKPPPPPKYDGPECQTARRLRALGHPKEADSWALACTAKGGTP